MEQQYDVVAPVVGGEPDEELETALEAVDADVPAEPTAEVEEPEPTDRRNQSRRAGKKEPKASVNLDDYEEFRQFKSERDRKQAETERALDEERQRRYFLEQQHEELRRAQEQAQLQALQGQLDEAVDPNERAAYIEQIAAIRFQEHYRRQQEWDAYRRGEVSKRGFDANDPRFNRQYRTAEEFQLDLERAEKDKLKADLASAQKASDPTVISETIRREVAKALQKQGFNQVETGEPEATAGDDEEAFQRDLRAAQVGRMSNAAFLKKWGDH